MTRKFTLTQAALAIALMAPAQTALAAPHSAAPEVQTVQGTLIPEGAYGVVHITRLVSAKLVVLNGKAGRGSITLRSPKAGHCAFMELRFVAGSLDEADHAEHGDDPVDLVILNERIAWALMKGRDIVSDDYRVTDDPSDKGADFLIRSGLGPHHGFVLNPGRNFWAELFSPRLIDVACDTPVTAPAATGRATGSDTAMASDR